MIPFARKAMDRNTVQTLDTLFFNFLNYSSTNVINMIVGFTCKFDNILV